MPSRSVSLSLNSRWWLLAVGIAVQAEAPAAIETASAGAQTQVPVSAGVSKEARALVGTEESRQRDEILPHGANAMGAGVGPSSLEVREAICARREALMRLPNLLEELDLETGLPKGNYPSQPKRDGPFMHVLGDSDVGLLSLFPNVAMRGRALVGRLGRSGHRLSGDLEILEFLDSAAQALNLEVRTSAAERATASSPDPDLSSIQQGLWQCKQWLVQYHQAFIQTPPLDHAPRVTLQLVSSTRAYPASEHKSRRPGIVGLFLPFESAVSVHVVDPRMVMRNQSTTLHTRGGEILILPSWLNYSISTIRARGSTDQDEVFVLAIQWSVDGTSGGASGGTSGGRLPIFGPAWLPWSPHEQQQCPQSLHLFPTLVLRRALERTDAADVASAALRGYAAAVEATDERRLRPSSTRVVINEELDRRAGSDERTRGDRERWGRRQRRWTAGSADEVEYDFSGLDGDPNHFTYEHFVGASPSAWRRSMHSTSPALQAWEAEVRQLAVEYARSAFLAPELLDVMQRELQVGPWVTKHLSRMHHELHSHTDAALSGVYYAAVPVGAGDLLLLDPRKSGAAVLNTIAIPPIENAAVLIPPWLLHGVGKTENDSSPRVAISFNAFLRPSSLEHVHRQCAAGGCWDASLECVAWAEQGECEENPSFMFSDCRSSCGMCNVLERQQATEWRGVSNGWAYSLCEQPSCVGSLAVAKDSRAYVGGDDAMSPEELGEAALDRDRLFRELCG